MKVFQRKSQFGWAGDDGLGLELIWRIKVGEKTATCCPLCLYSAEDVRATRENVGHHVTVIDHDGNPHCNIRVLSVFETTWGRPDPRLVEGEGFASAEAFKAALSNMWDDVLQQQETALDSSTVLLVEIFVLADGVALPS